MHRQEVSQRVREDAWIKRGNDAMVRVCILGFAIAIAAIVPVPWGWKIALFLAIMLVIGVLIPAVGRMRKKRALNQCPARASCGEGHARSK
jgi:hypothetical protein